MTDTSSNRKSLGKVEAYYPFRQQLEQRITDLESQLAEARRHNELLRSVADDDDAISDAMEAYGKHRHPARWDGEPWGQVGRQNHENAIRAAVQAALQAAIDGGAVKTAYSEGFEAGRIAHGDQPEPYPPYKIGTDMANDWLRGYRSAIDASALDATPPPD